MFRSYTCCLRLPRATAQARAEAPPPASARPALKAQAPATVRLLSLRPARALGPAVLRRALAASSARGLLLLLEQVISFLLPASFPPPVSSLRWRQRSRPPDLF